MRRVLYTLTVPEDAMPTARAHGETRLSKNPVVSGGDPEVTTIGTTPGNLQLDGAYRGKHAGIMAEEIEELFNSTTIDVVPFYGMDSNNTHTRTREDGYYSMENVGAGPADVRLNKIHGGGVFSWDGRITRTGTRKTHWRAVATNPQTVTNPFGSGTTAYVGAPANATKVRWSNDNGDVEQPTAVSTETTEHGDITLYDAKASSFNSSSSSPTLIFDLAYDEAGKTDAKVWDTHGASKTDADGVLQWQKVFDTGHVFEGDAVLDNGHIRVTMDDATNALSADRFSAGSWSSVTLGASDWQLYDMDLTRIGPARVVAQLEFENTIVDAGEETFYRYNAILHHGRDDIQFTDPPGQPTENTPDLDNLLSPIADTSTVDPQQTLGVRHRQETRK